jgi:transcriptional regulator with XRE-family HTH domain
MVTSQYLVEFMSKNSLSLNEIVGINLREIRKERGLSQEDFAEVCGLHRNYLSSIERGERNITLDILSQIAAAINVSPIQLLSR